MTAMTFNTARNSGLRTKPAIGSRLFIPCALHSRHALFRGVLVTQHVVLTLRGQLPADHLFEDHIAIKHSQQHVGIVNFFGFDLEEFPVKHDDVGPLADLE